MSPVIRSEYDKHENALMELIYDELKILPLVMGI
jgi:hypothetical protein